MDAQKKEGRKGRKSHHYQQQGLLLVLFKFFLNLALRVANADGHTCHSRCTLAKQVDVERDPTPDIPEPIIVPFL
ncbi:unnamed protein product [Dovyalis caffra]|uniref:Secreted protein n=1 Tax=Dovyalis caffra TaxID=77055 RepID=A0AAV1SRL4_9ROSI|nr:unnamed protein product [Dovyalis caffra]